MSQIFISVPDSPMPFIFRTEAKPAWTGVTDAAAGYPGVVVVRKDVANCIYYSLKDNHMGVLDVKIAGMQKYINSLKVKLGIEK